MWFVFHYTLPFFRHICRYINTIYVNTFTFAGQTVVPGKLQDCCRMRHISARVEKGVPKEQCFYVIGPSIAIERNNLKPSHSGNTYPVWFTAI